MQGNQEPQKTDSEKQIVLFDGVCNLCNATVRFIIKRDPHSHFQFASLQSTFAKTRLKTLTGPAPGDTLVLLQDDKIYLRSTAALRIARKLRFPWPLLGIFEAIPVRLRDWVYNQIAINRYKWFGRKEHCPLPAPEFKNRFIDSEKNSSS